MLIVSLGKFPERLSSCRTCCRVTPLVHLPLVSTQRWRGSHGAPLTCEIIDTRGESVSAGDDLLHHHGSGRALNVPAQTGSWAAEKEVRRCDPRSLRQQTEELLHCTRQTGHFSAFKGLCLDDLGNCLSSSDDGGAGPMDGVMSPVPELTWVSLPVEVLR